MASKHRNKTPPQAAAPVQGGKPRNSTGDTFFGWDGAVLVVVLVAYIVETVYIQDVAHMKVAFAQFLNKICVISCTIFQKPYDKDN